MGVTIDLLFAPIDLALSMMEGDTYAARDSSLSLSSVDLLSDITYYWFLIYGVTLLIKLRNDTQLDAFFFIRPCMYHFTVCTHEARGRVNV